MKYSYNWLKEFVPVMPTPDKLVEVLTMRAFEVEKVDVFGKDTVLDIKVLPNRAFDCLSHIGMAREIAAIAGIKYKVSSIKYKEDKSFKIKDYLKVEVQDKKLCPRYSARVVFDVKVGESPKWMQERLIACGLRPINNIVDITNYVMLETGQPLHAFDFDKISFPVIARGEATKQSRGSTSGLLLPHQMVRDRNDVKIIVRRAKKGERITTLDEDEYKLNENILVIADEKEPLAIAGVKGGKKAEVDKSTRTVILESANFDTIITRKSSKALNLRTDASIRFENGLDINLTIRALDRVVELIQKLAGGKIAAGVVDALAAKPKQISTAVAHSYAESLLGINIKSSKILNIFKRLFLPAHAHKKKGELFYEALVPSWRNDINTPEDLIEEIGRLYGYEKIPAEMPTSILVPAIKNEGLINEEKARNIMVGAGYAEVYNYSLIFEQDSALFRFKDLLGPRYPLSQDQKYLRPTLTVRLLKNIGENLKYFNNIRMFEIGKVFVKSGEKALEKKMIGGALCGKSAAHGVEKIFYEAKGAVDLFLEKLGVEDVWYDSYIEAKETLIVDANVTQIFHSVRRAQVKVGDEFIGWIGEANKNILSALGIDEPVAVFELDFDMISELVEEEIAYRAPSKYPAIERDLSVVVAQNVKVDDVLNIIENSSGPLVIDIDLVDIYESAGVPSDFPEREREEVEEGAKSLTFRLVFQSYEKTLTDAEVNKIMEKIIKAVEGEGWEIRS